MLRPIHISQAIRYTAASIRQKIFGSKRYTGNAQEICAQIVRNCWNGRYFQASTCHYREFWARDFGYYVEPLLKSGYRNEVLSTLKFALSHYERTGIKTTIRHKPFSFPNIYSPDSVALFFHALASARADNLLAEHHAFLQKEADCFAHLVLQDARVRTAQFSGMRDYAYRESSCYDHSLSILMARMAHKLGFDFPYTEKELVKTLAEYWTGTHYADDRKTNTCTGDANTLPYWLRVGKHFSRTIKTIQTLGLDTPLPLSYTHSATKMRSLELFVPNWQQNSYWPMLGFLWMQTVKEHSAKLFKTYVKAYSHAIERDGTLYEVYTKKGTPYRSSFYHADEGMLWAAYLASPLSF